MSSNVNFKLDEVTLDATYFYKTFRFLATTIIYWQLGIFEEQFGFVSI